MFQYTDLLDAGRSICEKFSGCFRSIQIYSSKNQRHTLGIERPHKKFFSLQSVAAAASFIYSSHIGLGVQMGILIVTGIIGTACFCVVEWSCRREQARNTVDVAAKLNDEMYSD